MYWKWCHHTPSKALNVIDRLLIIWKSNLSDKMKQNFFQDVAVFIFLYECTTWMITKYTEKTRWEFHQNAVCYLEQILEATPLKQQLYCCLLLLSEIIQVRQTRYAGHCWRSKNKFISNVHLWTRAHGCASVGWSVKTDLGRLYVNTRCSLKNLPGAMNDRDGWQEEVRELFAVSVI